MPECVVPSTFVLVVVLIVDEDEQERGRDGEGESQLGPLPRLVALASKRFFMPFTKKSCNKSQVAL